MITDGQNIFDFCVSETGDLNNLFDILRLNGLSVDDSLSSGMELVLPIVINEKEIYITTTFVKEYMRSYVKDNQNIFDLTAMYFGSMDYLFNLLKSNNFELNERLFSGTELMLDNINIGDENIKNMVIKNNLIFCNYGQMTFGDIIPGDYSDDYDTDNDYF